MADHDRSSGWDDVVVGAGSAGAALAARLSGHGGRRVLLVEAGVERLAEPAASAPLGMAVLSGYNWDYSAFVGPAPRGRRAPYSVGKMLGGSSAVNGAIALRGLPADFDGWAAAGNHEWAWDAVLPYFRALEADADFEGAEHGRDGPVPVRRPAPCDYDPAAVAFLGACRAHDLAEVADMNASGDPGAGPVPSNERAGRRVSSADAYLCLGPGTPGPTVWTRTRATRVLLSGSRAVGVEVVRDGGLTRVHADRVTVCAGGVNSPLLLERSGIGDARRLTEAGVVPVVDLPGVGADLADHAAVMLWAQPRPGVCRKGAPWHQVMGRVGPAGASPDLALFLAGNVTDDSIPEVGSVMDERIALAVSVMLLDSRSRGSVHVSGPSPDAEPVITLALASEPRDMERLMAGVRLARSLLSSPQMAEVLEHVLLWTDPLVSDDSRLRRAVSRFVTPLGHVSGTARMGPDDDPMAVVDQYGRVRQLENLRVADASVMPSPLRATPNLSCIMIAERVAAWMA
ncbi:GMC family oxidoreductase [Streptomyces sp. NPDC055287]